MAKKDFSQVETNRVYNTISELTQEPQELRKPRKSYTAQEALKYMNSLKTSGRKGIALPRINLAFTYKYVPDPAQGGTRGSIRTGPGI